MSLNTFLLGCLQPSIALAVVLLSAPGFVSGSAQSSLPLQAKISVGTMEGIRLDSGVTAYLGVPYAAPPVRELRWQPPQPAAPWKRTYHADRFGPECIQPLRAHNLNHYFGEQASSEDCLYLNIWAGQTSKAGDKRPVLVWIYGGGFTIGSANTANYGGESLAKKGVVFVTIGYRVGALGFMGHPELTVESPHHASGNYGLLDQVAALQWIQNNIAALGGDPRNVTIMGQSAGAGSVFYLQSSPLAAGLFQHAVGMSGGGFRMAPMSLAEAEASGLKMQEALKVNSLAELRLLPADKVLAAQADCQLGCSGTVRVGPDVDGYYLPATPKQIWANHKENKVPIMVGFTHDESSNELRTAKSLAAYNAAAQSIFGARTEEFLRLYPAQSDAEAKAMGAEAARDMGMSQGARDWADAQVADGGTAFVYMYNHIHPYTPGVTFADHDPKTVGSYHTSEVPYFLQTLDTYNLFRPTRDWTAADRTLSDEMSNALISFATDGVPRVNGRALPSYASKTEQLTEFSIPIRTIAFNMPRMKFIAATPVLPQPLGGTPAGKPRD